MGFSPRFLALAVCAVIGAAAMQGCSEGGDSSPTATAPTTTTTTTLPPAPSVAGRWVGELIVTQNINCNEQNDLTVDLAQTGSSVSGSGMLVTRRPANCGADSLSIVGTVGPSTVDLTASGQRDGFAYSLRLTGSVTGTRMAGTFQCTASTCNQVGTWALNRQ